MKDVDEIQTERTTPDFPDMGGMDASELIESLLSNEHIPRNLLHQLWVLFGKTTKLSFLTDSNIRDLMLQFELLRLTIIESIPKSAYDEELELQLIQIRMEFMLNLNRSKGSRMNERELIGSSTTASFSERPISSGTKEPGFFDKISKLFG